MYTTRATTRFTPVHKHRLPGVAWLRAAFATRRQRLKLAEMTDAQLADLGLKYKDAQREASKPFWDVPQHWLR